jgi:DNA recombination protein RmuC
VWEGFGVIEALSVVAVVLLLGVIVLLAILLKRRAVTDLSPLQTRIDIIEKGQERIEQAVKAEIATNREEGTNQARALREEVSNSLKNFNDSVLKQMSDISTLQKNQLEVFATRLTTVSESSERKLGDLTESNAKKMEELKLTVEGKLTQLQTDNANKLEEMRRTVDEKLQGTLDKRLGESFKQVSERLEQVHKGLGEMQTLANGVGDLKKVLTNVKTRGTWGEMQLANLLEQVLTPEQYAQNVATKYGSNEHVEFAIKLPGRDERDGGVVWLPIDAKFPKEDYERLVEAAEHADVAALEEAGKQLEARVKAEARDIRDKYIDPPHTTDFAILFLSTEGLYAEVLRRPGLMDVLQRDYRVTIAGPTVLGALLNSLQIGFRTLAIEKRSSEVWKVLASVKTEFGKFGDFMDRVQKKLQEASNVIDTAATRTKAIERKLRNVHELPTPEAAVLLGETKAAPGELDGLAVQPTFEDAFRTEGAVERVETAN